MKSALIDTLWKSESNWSAEVSNIWSLFMSNMTWPRLCQNQLACNSACLLYWIATKIDPFPNMVTNWAPLKSHYILYTTLNRPCFLLFLLQVFTVFALPLWVHTWQVEGRNKVTHVRNAQLLRTEHTSIYRHRRYYAETVLNEKLVFVLLLPKALPFSA